MWQLVRLELEYSGRFLLPILFLVPPALVVADLVSLWPFGHGWSSWGVFVSLQAFMVVWTQRNKERRERQLALLPLATHQLALARLASCAIPPAVALITYGVAHVLLKGGAFPASLVQMGLGWIVLVLGLLLMAQDLLLWTPRPGSSKPTLARLAVGPIVAAGLVLLIVSLQRLQAPAAATVVVDAVRAFLAAPQGPTRFLSLTGVFAFLTVLTFARRRSYLQK